MSLHKAVKDVLDSIDRRDDGEAIRIFTLIPAIQALRTAYAEPYVPMSDDELYAMFEGRNPSEIFTSECREIEQAVLNRLGVAPTLAETRNRKRQERKYSNDNGYAPCNPDAIEAVKGKP